MLQTIRLSFMFRLFFRVCIWIYIRPAPTIMAFQLWSLMPRKLSMWNPGQLQDRCRSRRQWNIKVSCLISSGQNLIRSMMQRSHVNSSQRKEDALTGARAPCEFGQITLEFRSLLLVASTTKLEIARIHHLHHQTRLWSILPWQMKRTRETSSQLHGEW